MKRCSVLILLLSPMAVTAQVEVQLEREAHFERILNIQGDYEASGVTVKDGEYYVVFDDDGRIAHVDSTLTTARLLGARRAGDQYEGIEWDPARQRFDVVVEALPSGRPGLVELDVHGAVTGRQEVPFPLTHANKGGEGLTRVERGGVSHLLLLLEGNHGRGGRMGRDAGHGMVLVLRPGAAGLEQVATLALPPEAAFEDYAGISHRAGRLAVVSQASAGLWVGELDPVTWTVSAGRRYAFPRRANGAVRYPKMEGVAWIDDRRLVVVSDEAERREDRDATESIHVFRLPD